MGEEHADEDGKNLRRLAAIDVAILILSLLIASYGIYAVIALEPTKPSPGVTYATLVISIIAALTSLISGIAFYMKNYKVAYLSAAFHILFIILEIIMGALIIALQHEALYGSLVLVGGLLSVICFFIGMGILVFRLW
ncbi:unnamed protein product [Hymenolepis diminuta]|uniref:Uncharacterized protein n=1 Tax=Hymenolepis diminuta TaxID=6216 RepID=A0A564YDE8_HYMDI|nr:unnamed protein product [Hymenolepis diminuta]